MCFRYGVQYNIVVRTVGLFLSPPPLRTLFACQSYVVSVCVSMHHFIDSASRPFFHLLGGNPFATGSHWAGAKEEWREGGSIQRERKIGDQWTFVEVFLFTRSCELLSLMAYAWLRWWPWTFQTTQPEAHTCTHAEAHEKILCRTRETQKERKWRKREKQAFMKYSVYWSWRVVLSVVVSTITLCTFIVLYTQCMLYTRRDICTTENKYIGRIVVALSGSMEIFGAVIRAIFPTVSLLLYTITVSLCSIPVSKSDERVNAKPPPNPPKVILP